MSNIIDAYCVYCCAKEIKRSTEASREMFSERSYVNRKRYVLQESPIEYLSSTLCKVNISILDLKYQFCK